MCVYVHVCSDICTKSTCSVHMYLIIDSKLIVNVAHQTKGRFNLEKIIHLYMSNEELGVSTVEEYLHVSVTRTLWSTYPVSMPRLAIVAHCFGVICMQPSRPAILPWHDDHYVHVQVHVQIHVQLAWAYMYICILSKQHIHVAYKGLAWLIKSTILGPHHVVWSWYSLVLTLF